MSDASRVAAAIDLRVRQLEAQGIMANQMLGHMQDLQRIYDAVSDRILLDLCRRFPGFERYARLMEGISEQSQTMAAAGTHPYGDLPELPEPLKASLTHLMRSAVELERELQAAMDIGRAEQAERLTMMRAPREVASSAHPQPEGWHISRCRGGPSLPGPRPFWSLRSRGPCHHWPRHASWPCGFRR